MRGLKKLKDKIMELFDLWGDTISEDEIRGAYPMERKEFYSLLMDMFKEGLIYPEVLDYGKQEMQWCKKVQMEKT